MAPAVVVLHVLYNATRSHVYDAMKLISGYRLLDRNRSGGCDITVAEFPLHGLKSGTESARYDDIDLVNACEPWRQSGKCHFRRHDSDLRLWDEQGSCGWGEWGRRSSRNGGDSGSQAGSIHFHRFPRSRRVGLIDEHAGVGVKNSEL